MIRGYNYAQLICFFSSQVQSDIKAATQNEEAADAEKWGKQGLENDWGNSEVSASKPDPLGKRFYKPHQ